MKCNKIFIFLSIIICSFLKLNSAAYESPFTGYVKPFDGGFDSRNFVPLPYNSTIERFNDTTFTISGVDGSGSSSQYSCLYKTMNCDFDFKTRITSYFPVSGSKIFTLGIYAFDTDFINAIYFSSINKGCCIYIRLDIDGTSEFQFKYKDVGFSSPVSGVSFSFGDAVWVRLVRIGDVFYGYSSTDGSSWTLVSSVNLSGIGSEIGLSIYTYSDSCLPERPFGRFDNISGALCPGEQPEDYIDYIARDCCESVESSLLDRIEDLETDVFRLNDCCDKHFSGVQRDKPSTRRVTGSGSAGNVLVLRSPGCNSVQENLIVDEQED